MNSTSSMVESEKNNRTGKRIVGKREAKKMTIPRLELGISRVSGARVSHCTIQSCFGFIPAFYERSDAALDRARHISSYPTSDQQKHMSNMEKKKHSLCGCITCFVVWLFPICLSLAVALYFSPNERIADIEE